MTCLCAVGRLNGGMIRQATQRRKDAKEDEKRSYFPLCVFLASCIASLRLCVVKLGKARGTRRFLQRLESATRSLEQPEGSAHAPPHSLLPPLVRVWPGPARRRHSQPRRGQPRTAAG